LGQGRIGRKEELHPSGGIPKMTEPRVYKPNRAIAVIILLAAIFFVTVCAGVLLVGLKDVLSGQDVNLLDLSVIITLVVMVLLGGWLGVGGVALLMVRVVVDDQGLAKSYRAGPLPGFSFVWDVLEAWGLVTEPGEGNYQTAWFKVPGWRWPATVSAIEVSRPGFDRFLEDTRARAGAKERVAS
jgi:hypothetical protein